MAALADSFSNFRVAFHGLIMHAVMVSPIGEYLSKSFNKTGKKEVSVAAVE
jgi:hypothetical protein